MNRRLKQGAGALAAVLLAGGTLVAEVPGGPTSKDYNYRMKGRVRLLLFWVGKDNVGGGRISIGLQPEPQGGWSEEVSVLFGSNPDRVPGGINRWGYGRERALWAPNGASPARLSETVFEGFMRHSGEESLSEVRANNQAETARASFKYEGIRSRVAPGEARAEVRVFSATQDFDYVNAAPIFCSYEERLKRGGVDRQRSLQDPGRHYTLPLGFLTAVRRTTLDLLDSSSTVADWTRQRPVTGYAYNGKAYRLQTRNIRLQERFELPLENGSKRPFSNVVRLDYRIHTVATGDTHDFSIWVPAAGPLRGVPLRIEDRPRWWLRIELNLIPEDQLATTSVPLASPRPDCKEVQRAAQGSN